MAKTATKITDKLAAIFSENRRATLQIRSAIDDIESDIVAARLELARIEALPVDGETIARRVDALIASASADAENYLVLEALAAPNGAISSVFPHTAPLPRAAAFGLACLLGDGNRVRANVIARLSASAEAGISDETRAKETARLKAEIADFERQLETIHREAERAGLRIPRRADADPAALLAADQDGG